MTKYCEDCGLKLKPNEKRICQDCKEDREDQELEEIDGVFIEDF